MVPQDQQDGVASPGVIREELVLDSIAINVLTADTHNIRLGLRGQNNGVVERHFAGVGARATLSARERSAASTRLR